MANNLSVKDATGTTQTIETTESGGVHTPHHTLSGPLGQALAAASLPVVLASDQTVIPIRPNRPTSATLTSASISAAASGDNTLISGTSAQTIRVFRMFLVTAAAVGIKFRDGTGGTDLTGVMSFAANGGFVFEFSGEPWFVTSTANGFVMNLDTAIQVSGRIYYEKS